VVSDGGDPTVRVEEGRDLPYYVPPKPKKNWPEDERDEEDEPRRPRRRPGGEDRDEDAPPKIRRPERRDGDRSEREDH
jgi:hypothetical protein